MQLTVARSLFEPVKYESFAHQKLQAVPWQAELSLWLAELVSGTADPAAHGSVGTKPSADPTSLGLSLHAQQVQDEW